MAQRLVSHYRENDNNLDFSQIGSMLGLPGCIDTTGYMSLKEASSELLLQVMKEWLLKEGNSRWLVVFDNNDDLGSVKVTDFIPPGDAGSVIITTRKLGVKRYGCGIEVGSIDEEAGISLFLKSADKDPLTLDAAGRFYSH